MSLATDPAFAEAQMPGWALPSYAGGHANPFEDDFAHDLPFITTERRLVRLATIAADVGARFAREGIVHDPASWMLTPRKMFGDTRALDACQKTVGFNRALVLHGLSLGLDGDPQTLDQLLDDEQEVRDGFSDEERRPSSSGLGTTPLHREDSASDHDLCDLQLFTGTIDGEIGASGRHVQAYWAVIATDEGAVRRKLRVRYKHALADQAVLHHSFDPADVLAQVLLSKPLQRMLTVVAADPGGELAAGLDLHVEQRFSV